MRLLRLELHDVGQFRHYSVDLSGDVIGITGGNGVGKSTVLSAIQYAVAGDLSRLGDKEAVFVNRTPNAKDRPYARLVFDPGDGKEVILTRNLPVDDKAATRKLTYDGKTYTSKADVDAIITKWTGLSPKGLSDFVFVAQGSLTDVITDQSGKRAEVLQKLFGVSEAEDARVALLEHLSKLPQPTDPELLAALRHQTAEAEIELRDAENELADIDEPDPEQEEVDRRTLTAAKRGRELAIAAESARIRVREAEAVLAVAPPEKPNPDLVLKARETLDSWSQYRVACAVRKTASENCDAAVDLADRVVAESIFDDPGPEPKPSADLLSLRESKFRATIVTAAEHGSDCPVCGSSFELSTADKQSAANLLEDLEIAEEELAADVRRWRVRCDEADRTRKKINETRQRAHDLLRALDAIPVPEKPEIEESVAKQLLDLSAKAEMTVNADAARRSAATNTIRTARVIIDSADENDIPSDQIVAAAERRLASATDTRTTRAAATARLSAARKAYDSAKSSLDKAVATGSEYAKTGEWRTIVEGAVKILHKDAAPAATIRACLASLSDDLNNRLGHLGAAFRVVVNEDGGLSAKFPDKTVSSRLLSGGQKVVLSLAWRLAVLDRYAPKAGLLCLDEPTNHLDEARVAALKDAIVAWKPHAKNRQFVIVTHVRKLAAACDKVIQLG